jgi:hypothetical protein
MTLELVSDTLTADEESQVFLDFSIQEIEKNHASTTHEELIPL